MENSTETSSVLSIDSIKKAIDWLKSPDRVKEEMERARVQVGASRLVQQALDNGLITIDDASRYSWNISINGFLVLHPDDKNREVFERLSLGKEKRGKRG